MAACKIEVLGFLTGRPHGRRCIAIQIAIVAELADAHGSGPCTGNGVGVRVPSMAPRERSFRGLIFSFGPYARRNLQSALWNRTGRVRPSALLPSACRAEAAIPTRAS